MGRRAAQAVEQADHTTVVEWTADFKPDELANVVDEMMTVGAAAMKIALDRERGTQSRMTHEVTTIDPLVNTSHIADVAAHAAASRQPVTSSAGQQVECSCSPIAGRPQACTRALLTDPGRPIPEPIPERRVGAGGSRASPPRCAGRQIHNCDGRE